MLTRVTKNEKRGHVHDRIRKKMQGTAERPRLNVYRSLNHIYVQVIDDLHGKTLVSASTAEGKKDERSAPAATWLRRKRWARPLPSAPRPRASRRLCSIAAATFITGA